LLLPHLLWCCAWRLLLWSCLLLPHHPLLLRRGTHGRRALYLHLTLLSLCLDLLWRGRTAYTL
jgi:hypothetical protein